MGAHTSSPAAKQALDHLRRIVQSLRTPAATRAGKAAVSGAQLLVLQQLREHGPATVNQLAALTLTHQSSVSMVVSRLAKGGFVRRQVGAQDRRAVQVSLTPSGERQSRKAAALPHARLQRTIRELPPRQQRQLSLLLGKLVEQMGLPAGPPPMFFEGRH